MPSDTSPAGSSGLDAGAGGRPVPLAPAAIRPPFGRYSHGLALPAGARLVVVSGTLGVAADDSVPEGVEAQAELCFSNVAAILAEGGMDFGDVVRIVAYVTRREDFPLYMAVRDRWVREPLPVSTLLVVSGFTRAEFKVEVEVTAAKMP